MPFAASPDGTLIHYEHLGGDGPPLLMAHATGFCGALWEPICRGLSDHFSCWTLDFRAHGSSGVPGDEGFAWSFVAQDAVAIIDTVAPDEQWFGAGHSMGGAALVMCEQSRPGQFGALWAYEPIIMPPDVRAVATGAGDNPLAAAARRRRPSFASRRDARSNYGSKPPMNTFDSAVLDLYVEFGMVEEPDGSVALACRPENEAMFYVMGGQHETFDHLADTQVRTTVARGRSVPFTPSAFAADVAHSMPNGTLEEHPSLSHFGPMESPGDITRSIRHALSGRTR